MGIKAFDDVQLDVKFTKATKLENLVSEENISISFGKLARWFDELGNGGITLTTTGSGNAFTGATFTNGELTLTKGSTFLTAHPTITKSSDTTSTASPKPNATFTAVDSVTRDTNGHVTKINTKTITLPNYILSTLYSGDLNDLIASTTSEVRYYYAGGNNACLNVPEQSTSGAAAFGLVVYRNASGYTIQECTTTGVNKYIRQCSDATNKTWSAWKKIAVSTDIKTYAAGTGLSLSGTTFNHSNSVTAVTTAGFLKLKYDAQGHITGTSAVTKADITGLGIPSSDTNTTYTLSGAYGTNSNTWVTTLTPSSGSATTSTVPTASTSVYGITKLSSATNSTSTALAATASAVKSAYDLANGKSTVSFTASLTSGTKVGTIVIDGTPTDLYCQTNTDTKVTQSNSTTANFRPLMLGYTNTTTVADLAATVTNQIYATTKIYAQPSTGNVYATKFVGTATAAETLVSQTMTADTLDVTAGNFAFKGNNLIGGVNDWVGVQFDAGNDKIQLMGNSSRLLFRQNDTGGTNGTAWGDWVSLMAPSDVVAGAGIKVTPGGAATGINKTVTIAHSNSVTAVTTATLYKIKFDAQGHITGTTAVAAGDLPSHTHNYAGSASAGGSATTVQGTLTNPTAGTTYYIPFHSGVSTAAKTLLNNNGISYQTLEGTADALGYGMLKLGNATASGTAANKYGYIRIYGKGAGYTNFIPLNDSESSYTINIPAAAGTMALTKDLNGYLPLTGGTMTGNISFNMYNSTQIPLKVYGGDGNGQGISVGAGGATIVGAGESAKACESLLGASTEQLWLTSDQGIYFYTNCNTIANKAGVILSNSRQFYPDTTNTGSLGTSSYRWGLSYIDCISSPKVTSSYLAGNQTGALIQSTASAGSYVMLAKLNSTNGYFTHGVYNAKYLLQYTAKTTVDASTNNVTKSVTLLDEDGNTTFPGIVKTTATTASTSKTTGSLITAGGLGVAGVIWAGGVIHTDTSVYVERTATGGGFMLRHNTTTLGQWQISTMPAAGTASTAGTQGVVLLTLGNGTAVDASGSTAGAENARGNLRIYGTGTTYISLQVGNPEGSKTLTLPPTSGGWVVGTSTTAATGSASLPVYINAFGQATAITTLGVANGGTGKTSLSDVTVGTANKLGTNAGSATLPVYFSGGIPVVTTAPKSGAWFSSFTGAINSSGVLEIGRYLDFHSTNTGTSNFDVRLDASSTSLMTMSSDSGNTQFRISGTLPRLRFTQTTTDKAYDNANCGITVQPANTNGTNMLIQSGGNMVIGGGEFPANLYTRNLDSVTGTGENMYIGADSNIYLYTNANNVATADNNDHKRWQLSTGGHTYLPTSGQIRYNNSGFEGILTAATLKEGVTWTLPAAKGTIALTSDLSKYLPLAGGTMTGNITMNTASLGIIVKMNETSNYGSAIKWYKGGVSQAKYDPAVGHHNTGGDGTGSITILPYATDTDPWGKNVGLYIGKGMLKLDGTDVSLAGHKHAAGDITSGTLSVARGGTGAGTFTANAVLCGNTTSAIKAVATANGAAYATAANGALTFGTLPIAQGGTGKTTALAAITALGGASILSQGTNIPDNSDLNTYITPGTYYVAASANTATIKNAPRTGSGFKLIVEQDYSTNYRRQTAYSGGNTAYMYVRTSTDKGANWSDWVTFSTSAHTHNYAGSSSAGGAATTVQATLHNPSEVLSLVGIPFFSSTPTTGAKTLYTNNSIRFSTIDGTTTEAGYGLLVLGNGTASGTAGNKAGQIRLYGTNTGYTTFKSANTSTSSYTITYPALTGKVALTRNTAFYGTCSTAAATVAKVVAATDFVLETGAKVIVKFTVTNTAASPTLNVNSTGAKPIYYRGSAISASYLAANRTYTFVYNGTQYELVGDINTNSSVTATNITVNASTNNSIIRPLLFAASTANPDNKTTSGGGEANNRSVSTTYTGGINMTGGAFIKTSNWTNGGENGNGYVTICAGSFQTLSGNFIGNLTGTAAKANSDENGKNIVASYAPKMVQLYQATSASDTSKMKTSPLTISKDITEYDFIILTFYTNATMVTRHIASVATVHQFSLFAGGAPSQGSAIKLWPSIIQITGSASNYSMTWAASAGVKVSGTSLISEAAPTLYLYSAYAIKY